MMYIVDKEYKMLMDEYRKLESENRLLRKFLKLYDRWESSIRHEVHEVTYDNLLRARKMLGKK